MVALSSAISEFMAASFLVQEVIYIRRLLTNLGRPQDLVTEVGKDNCTCITLSEGAVGGSDRAKYIDLRIYFVHDAVKDKIVRLHSIKSKHNVADILTKAFSEPKLTVLLRTAYGAQTTPES